MKLFLFETPLYLINCSALCLSCICNNFIRRFEKSFKVLMVMMYCCLLDAETVPISRFCMYYIRNILFTALYSKIISPIDVLGLCPEFIKQIHKLGLHSIMSHTVLLILWSGSCRGAIFCLEPRYYMFNFKKLLICLEYICSQLITLNRKVYLRVVNQMSSRASLHLHMWVSTQIYSMMVVLYSFLIKETGSSITFHMFCETHRHFLNLTVSNNYNMLCRAYLRMSTIAYVIVYGSPQISKPVSCNVCIFLNELPYRCKSYQLPVASLAVWDTSVCGIKTKIVVARRACVLFTFIRIGIRHNYNDRFTLIVAYSTFLYKNE